MKKITSTIILLFLIVTCALAQNTIEDGKMLFDEKKFEQAKEIFSGLLKMSNNNHEVNYYLGLICYVSERNYDDAEEYFLKSVELDPNNAQYHYMLGANYGSQAQEASIFSQLSLASSCKEEFEKAVELDPSHLDARVSLIQYLIQAPGIAGGSIYDARTQTKELEKYDKYLSQIMIAGIECEEENFANAEKAYLSAEAADPSRIGAYNALGYLYLTALNQPDKAMEQFKKLVEVGGEYANSHDSLGDGYAHKGMYEEALKCYSKALEIDPEFESSLFNMGKINEKLNDKKAAVKWYKKYLKIYKNGRYADDAEGGLDNLE